MKKLASALILSLVMLFSFEAFAVDTNEPLDKGAFEVDPTFTLDSLQAKKYGKPSVSTELNIGYGVLDAFTINGAISYGTEDGLNGGAVGTNLGLLWTPYDSDNIDIDVMLDFGMEIGGGEYGYVITPGFEFNYDIEPDQAFLGFYLRFGLPIYGAGYVRESPSDDEEGGNGGTESKADVGINLAFGAYYTIAEIHQILLEGGFSAMNLAKNKTEKVRVEGGYLAIGYNVQITDTFELTTELSFNFKHEDDENFYSAIAIGGIFGIPNAQ